MMQAKLGRQQESGPTEIPVRGSMGSSWPLNEFAVCFKPDPNHPKPLVLPNNFRKSLTLSEAFMLIFNWSICQMYSKEKL